MEISNLKNRRTYVIIGLVTLFSLFALWLRLIPMFMMGNTDILMMVGSDDPLYNLRQIEQMLANNLGYAWFDPMSLYPLGFDNLLGPPLSHDYRHRLLDHRCNNPAGDHCSRSCDSRYHGSSNCCNHVLGG